MQYVSQSDLNAFAAIKRADVRSVEQTTRVMHRRETEKATYFSFWIALLLTAVVCGAMWIYAHYQSLKIMYKKEVEWFAKRYTLGPRPLGDENVDETCLYVSAEYPGFAQAFLAQSCRSLPQTSAIFLLTMLQTFGDKMEGIHYAGSRAQLRGDRFATFIKSYEDWNVPDNPWRFLFASKTTFGLSVAVQKAQAKPDGATMLKALFNGGLCAVARQFYDPDTDAATMCQELLDEQVVYYQSCQAARLAAAFQQGSTIGTTAMMGTAVAGKVGAYVAEKVGSQVALGIAERLSLQVGADTACAAFAAIFTFGLGEIGCAALAFTLTAVTTATATAAVVGAATGISYAASDCPFSQYYTYTREPNGSYKKKAWEGDPKDLPPRAKEEDKK